MAANITTNLGIEITTKNQITTSLKWVKDDDGEEETKRIRTRTIQ